MRRALFLLRGETVVSGDAGAPNIHVQVKACSSAKYIVSYKKKQPYPFLQNELRRGNGRQREETHSKSEKKNLSVVIKNGKKNWGGT